MSLQCCLPNIQSNLCKRQAYSVCECDWYMKVWIGRISSRNWRTQQYSTFRLIRQRTDTVSIHEWWSADQAKSGSVSRGSNLRTTPTVLQILINFWQHKGHLWAMWMGSQLICTLRGQKTSADSRLGMSPLPSGSQEGQHNLWGSILYICRGHCCCNDRAWLMLIIGTRSVLHRDLPFSPHSCHRPHRILR